MYCSKFNNTASQNIRAVAIQPDGKVFFGTANDGVILKRLNTDGSEDTSFNSPIGVGSNVYDVAVLSKGQILVAGNMTVNSASNPLSGLIRTARWMRRLRPHSRMARFQNSCFSQTARF